MTEEDEKGVICEQMIEKYQVSVLQSERIYMYLHTQGGDNIERH